MSRRQYRTSDQSALSQQSRQTTPAAPDRGDPKAPPFFNTTFSTHRVSPLHVGAGGQLSDARLELLSRRLRDLLVGDVVRGVQISLESTETAAGRQLGALQSVRIRWFEASDVLGGGGGEPNNDARRGAMAAGQGRGLWIEIRHETAAYVALLLPGFGQGTTSTTTAAPPNFSMQQATGNNHAAAATAPNKSHFLDLPLMLMRMPLPLKNILGEWLSTTFDCHVSRLNLGTKTIVGAWEDWIELPGLLDRSSDVTVTLAFNAPLPDPDHDDGTNEPGDVDMLEAAGLRSIDVTVSARDLRKFVRAGAALPPSETAPKTAAAISDPRERRRLAGPNTDDGWAWLSAGNNSSIPKQPFTNALARYLEHHLALNLFHPSVRVAQLSCGGYTLAQGKLKMLHRGDGVDDVASQAAWMFVTKLGERISGGALPSIFE